jgi:hypothetical protein
LGGCGVWIGDVEVCGTVVTCWDIGVMVLDLALMGVVDTMCNWFFSDI